MKFFTSQNQHFFSWEQICQGFWQRYPNPYSTHVLSSDIISQTIKKGKLFTKRLIIKTNSLPKWGERLISGPRNVCLLEESIIDLENKSLTTYTRNVGYSSLMSVYEKCVYKPMTNNATDVATTQCERSAFLDCKLRGLSTAVERFALERYKKNVIKSIKGFEVVLKNLYGTDSKSINKEKLRHASETAKKIASAIVVLN